MDIQQNYNLMCIWQIKTQVGTLNWDWSESCQFTIYKKGQYYDWHCDSWDKPYIGRGTNKRKD